MNSPALRPSLYAFTLKDLRAHLKEKGFAQFAADQVYDWVYRKVEFEPLLWSNVGVKLREYISTDMDIYMPQISWHGLSKDGTRKFLIKMRDGQTVETVAIPAYDRLTLCISSQVGCAIGCTFCHTGTMGLKRHLTPDEIVGQYMTVKKFLRDEMGPDAKITNIVYMGQGEPLHNYENVKTATMIFMENKGIYLGQRKITLSTSGLVPQIEKLNDFPPVNLAISLHAAHDNIRTELMPINKVYDLNRLFKAIKSIHLKAHRSITYEYILIDGLNDRQEDVDALLDLLNVKESKVNIIPFNDYPGSKFKKPSKEKIMWFRDQLNAQNLVCTVRTTKGEDILAACGQLKSFVESGKTVENKLNLWN